MEPSNDCNTAATIGEGDYLKFGKRYLRAAYLTALSVRNGHDAGAGNVGSRVR